MWTIGKIADLVGGTLSPAADRDVEVQNFQIRAYSCNRHSCFIAADFPTLLPGGNQMVGSALGKKGARLAIVESTDRLSDDQSWVLVPNVNDAARTLAQSGRDQFCGKLIGITGSSGKSSVKVMLNHVLKQAGITWVTKSNQNLTPHIMASLPGIAPTTQFAVLEVGLYFGDTVRNSVALARPHIGIITSIGLNHALNFEDPEAEIFESKTDLLRGLENGGTAILPEYSERFDELLDAARQSPCVDQVIVCGESDTADVQLLDVARRGELQIVTCRAGSETFTFDVPYPGRHMVENATLVAGAVVALGQPVALMEHLSTAPKPHSATRRYRLDYPEASIEVVNDTFNSGVLAVNALVHNASERRAKRKFLLIGDIGQLEEGEFSIHQSLAPAIDAAGFTHVFTVGRGMQRMAENLSTPASSFMNRFKAAKAMGQMLENGDLVFLKASASMKFDDVFAHMTKRAKSAEVSPTWVIEDHVVGS